MCDEFDHENYNYIKLENLSLNDIKELGITPEQYEDMGDEMRALTPGIVKVDGVFYSEEEK